MTGDDPIKVPLLDETDRLGEALAVLPAGRIPQEALLPDGISLGVHDGGEEFRQDARGGAGAGLGELFGGGQVEDEVGLDHGLGGLVQEDELLVLVRVDVLVVELGVELGADVQVALVGGGEDVAELGAFGLGVRFSLLGQAVHANHLGLRVFLRPGLEEDVVLEVGGDDVLDGAEGGDFGLDFGGEGDGGEDGEGAGGELDEGGAAADFEQAEAQEGDAEGGDGRGDVADHHDLGWVRGDEFGGGFGGHCGGWCWW